MYLGVSLYRVQEDVWGLHPVQSEANPNLHPQNPVNHSASQEGHLPPDTLEPHSMHTPSPTSRPMVLLLYPT